MADALIASFTKRFSGAVIRGELHLPARRHSITVLFGPSGCGKTTVLRCLAGLETPEAGTIQYGAETWFDAGRALQLTPQQRGIGFVFQDYALFPHLTVAGNVGYGLRGLSASERQRRVDELLERFELTAQARQHPRQLSGGQQQRVALARSLACRPKLLLLDEPLSALDTALREQLRGELRRLLAACNIPVLLVTHDRNEALALADEIVVLVGGKVLQAGPILDVFNRPASPEVARLVGVETVLPGIITSTHEGLVTVEINGTALTAVAPEAPGKEVFVCIRGEDVILQRDPTTATSVRNRFAARVKALQPQGALVRVELEAGFPLSAVVTRPACVELDLREGQPLTALVKAPAVHLLPR